MPTSKTITKTLRTDGYILLHPVIPTSRPFSPPLHPEILPLHTAKSPIYPVKPCYTLLHTVRHCYFHVTPRAGCRIQIFVPLFFLDLLLLHKIVDFTDQNWVDM